MSSNEREDDLLHLQKIEACFARNLVNLSLSFSQHINQNAIEDFCFRFVDYDSPFRFLDIIGRLLVTINCHQMEVSYYN